MKPRINKPEKGNKYYINTADGGWNGARGNPLRRNKDLTALPNCISIYGWFNEIGGKGMVYLKAPWYPYAVISAAKREGLGITQRPTVGGIMVWTGGKYGDGHVAGVAEVHSQETILCVESEYYGRDWATFKRTKGDGNWRGGCYWMNESYKYQGCIRNPFIKEEEDLTKAETEALIRSMFPNQFDANMARYEAELKYKPADKYAEDALAWCKEMGFMVGDTTGNQMPQSKVKREDLAVILKALYTD